MISSGKAKDVLDILDTNNGQAFLKGSVKLHVRDAEGNSVGAHTIANWGGDDDGVVDNQTLDTAKVIFSKLAAGQTEYKIGKIMFGNAGHDFANPKAAVPALSTDVELNAITHIRSSLTAASDQHFTYTDGGSSTVHRMAVIEKDITASHITFGPNGNQFIVRVPVSFDEFNYRDGINNEDNTVLYDDNVLAYDFIAGDGTITSVRNVNAGGSIVSVPAKPIVGGVGTHTEIKYNGSNGPSYDFKNGLDANGDVAVGGVGTRPQEISEILLSSAIVDEGGATYSKLASSRMTSGLLVFPEGFEFTYEWTLTWTFA